MFCTSHKHTIKLVNEHSKLRTRIPRWLTLFDNFYLKSPMVYEYGIEKISLLYLVEQKTNQ